MAGSSWCARRATQGERPSESPDAWEVFVQGVNLVFADQTKAEVAEIGAQKVAQAAEQATAADMARAASQAAQSGAEAAAEAAAGAASAAAASAATLVDGTAHASVDRLMVGGFQYSPAFRKPGGL